MALLRSRNSHRPARSAAWPATVGSIAAIAFLAAAGGGADMGPLEGARVRWSRQFANPVGHPMPLRGENGVEGIVVTLGDGSVTLVDAGGKARWRAKLDLPADAGAVCGTLRPGSNPCVVATDVWASVYCFDSKGKRMWKLARASRSGGFRTPSIVDLDGDGTREVVVSDSRGRLLVIGANGKVRMEVTAGNYRVSGPTIASGRHLIFATDAGDVYRLTPAGDLIWACRPGARYGRSLPVLLGGKSGEVALLPCSFVSDKPGLAMLDAATGAFLMRAPSEVQSYQSTVVADLNADGHPTVLYGDKNSQLYCLDARGQRLWATRLPGRGIFHAPAALASGSRSMILQTVRGEGPDGRCLYALDGHGRVMDGLALKGGGGSCPLVCRFSGETGLSLVTLSASGVLERRDLPPPWSSAGVLWAGPPEGRPGRSALPDAGETPALRSPTPSRRRAVLGANSLEATVPAGAVYASVRVVHPDARSVTILRLPASGGARTTVPVRIPSVGRYEVDVKWLDNRSRSVGAHARYVMVLDDGLTRDAEHQASFERAMQQAMEAMPARSPLISRLLYACRGIYATARAERSGEAFDGLRTERDRCLALVSLMRRAPTASDLVAVPIANPWGRTDAARTLREGKSLNSIAIEMVGNERESRAVLLANLTARAMTVRVERGPFGSSTKPPSAQPGDSLLKLHEAIAVTPTTTGMPVEDALPELGPASTLRLGPGECRTLWMTVSSAQLAEGKHTGTLRIGDVASLKPPTEVRVTVRVSRVRLPDRLRYRHCNWLYLSGMRDETTLERVLQDALGHGTSVFVIPPPTVRLDGAGRALSVEGAQHDWLARRLLGRAALLISGAPALSWHPAPPQDRSVADAGFAEAIRAYAAHMRRLGWDHREFSLYLQDEPGLTGPDHSFAAFTEQVRRVKAADPNMGIYANPAGGAAASLLKPLAGLVDVWCPDLHLFRTDPQGLEPIFRSGREWWNYEAPGDQRNLSALGFYRMQAWVAFRHGMQGAGYWVHSNDPYWFDGPGQSSEYGAVYLTDGTPIASKRWEATRDGIEDYELLSMLRDAASRTTGAWSDDARRLLNAAVGFVTAKQEQASDIGRQTEPFEPDYRTWMRHRAAIVAHLERAPTQP